MRPWLATHRCGRRRDPSGRCGRLERRPRRRDASRPSADPAASSSSRATTGCSPGPAPTGRRSSAAATCSSPAAERRRSGRPQPLGRSDATVPVRRRASTPPRAEAGAVRGRRGSGLARRVGLERCAGPSDGRRGVVGRACRGCGAATSSTSSCRVSAVDACARVADWCARCRPCAGRAGLRARRLGGTAAGTPARRPTWRAERRPACTAAGPGSCRTRRRTACRRCTPGVSTPTRSGRRCRRGRTPAAATSRPCSLPLLAASLDGALAGVRAGTTGSCSSCPAPSSRRAVRERGDTPMAGLCAAAVGAARRLDRDRRSAWRRPCATCAGSRTSPGSGTVERRGNLAGRLVGDSLVAQRDPRPSMPARRRRRDDRGHVRRGRQGAPGRRCRLRRGGLDGRHPAHPWVSRGVRGRACAGRACDVRRGRWHAFQWTRGPSSVESWTPSHGERPSGRLPGRDRQEGVVPR